MKRLAGDAFPYGTLIANVLGCLAIGLLFSAVEEKPGPRAFLIIGLLGGFTTFSAFGHVTVALASKGQFGPALGNVAANMILCLVAVFLGRFMVRGSLA